MERPRLQSYLKLVAQKAWSAWYKLPPQHKSWIDPEDLIQDGVLFARYSVLPRWRPHRAKFTTYLSMSLENYYKNMLADRFTQKRNKCQTVPLCSVLYGLANEDSLQHEIRAVHGLVRIIDEASPMLRQYLHHWFFTKGNVHCHGSRFEVAREEFCRLASRCHFGREDFEYLLCNETWRVGLQHVQKEKLMG